MPKQPFSSWITTICLSATVLSSCFLVSCGAPAKNYYFLTPAGPPPSQSGKAIGVGPVSIPAYINQPNIVFQETGNRLNISESNHWAGDLEDNITSVIAQDLARWMKTGNYRTYPWSNDKELQYQITVDIRQLHGTPDGDAYIDASWRVYSLPDRRIISSRSWSGREALRHDGYEELVAAESRLLDRLAAQISKGL